MTNVASAYNVGREEQKSRRKNELQRVFGGIIGELLADVNTTEVLVNPDGRVYVDRM
jgi:Flp pilus assembly CpaF family ATPase